MSSRREREVFPQIHLDSDALFRSLAAQESEHFADDFIEIKLGFLERRLSEESPDTSHDFSCCHTIASDLLGSLMHLRQVWRVGRKPVQAGLSIRYHGGQRLVNFVGDGCGKFADCGRPCRSRQPRLTIVQSFLHILPVIDIDE
jgi:hypothetical protein